MARHRRPDAPLRSTRPGVHRRVARPAVTVAATFVVAGAVTVGTAFAMAGSATIDTAPAPRGGVMTATAATAGTDVPSPKEIAAITAAVRGSSLTAAVSPGSYEVTGAVLARSDRSWAWVELVPVTEEVDRAEGVLHRGDSGWELVQLGSYEVGCGIVPDSVAADLALECPSDVPAYSA